MGLLDFLIAVSTLAYSYLLSLKGLLDLLIAVSTLSCSYLLSLKGLLDLCLLKLFPNGLPANGTL